MAGVFDFCEKSRVIQELPPETGSAVSMNGWEFSAKPGIPYRRTFNVQLHGLHWYFNSHGTRLDLTTDPTRNAGRLLEFYRQHQTWDTFDLRHQYLGNIVCKFTSPVTVPPALDSSNGLIGSFDIKMTHYNPSYE